MKSEEFLSPEEKAVLKVLLDNPHYRPGAEVLRDALIESRKTLREVFDKLTAAVEVFKNESR
jgi:hypothetical protein